METKILELVTRMHSEGTGMDITAPFLTQQLEFSASLNNSDSDLGQTRAAK